MCLLISLILIFNVSAAEYKVAPLPHYDTEKEYGWLTTVPADNPAHPHSMMKIWQVRKHRFVFIDRYKDGTCDFVADFLQTDEVDDKGRPLYVPLRGKTCKEVEIMVRMFLEREKE